MLPPRWITVHHDGLDLASAAELGDAAERIEHIRLSHTRKGWGDIGYHYLVDREGRIWQGRSLAWQGSHVKGSNEGNIGICCLGNFEVEQPSRRQLDALKVLLRRLSGQHGIDPACVRTHQEWPGAHTACPGRNLQSAFERAWRAGSFGGVGSRQAQVSRHPDREIGPWNDSGRATPHLG